MGGETQTGVSLVPDEGGLSPRGRGNLPDNEKPLRIFGSIPAWAGKPSSGRSAPSRPRVYPRVGGETAA